MRAFSCARASAACGGKPRPRLPEVLDTEQELALARHLVRFADVLREVEADLLPHKLCEYIFDLSGKSLRARACVWQGRLRPDLKVFETSQSALKPIVHAVPERAVAF